MNLLYIIWNPFQSALHNNSAFKILDSLSQNIIILLGKRLLTLYSGYICYDDECHLCKFARNPIRKDLCYVPHTAPARSQFLKSNSDLFYELGIHNARLTDWLTNCRITIRYLLKVGTSGYGNLQTMNTDKWATSRSTQLSTNIWVKLLLLLENTLKLNFEAL